MIRSYSELVKLGTFEERFEYLKLSGSVGIATFGHDRYLNQALYCSEKWKKTRRYVIIRDEGCDLGIDSMEIQGKIIIHHMNPISIRDIESGDSSVFDPEFLICTSFRTHNAIHYSDESLLPKDPIIREPGDTKLW